MGRSSSPPPQHKQYNNHRRPFRGDHYHHYHHRGGHTRDTHSEIHGSRDRTATATGTGPLYSHHAPDGDRTNHHKLRKLSSTSLIRCHGNGYANHQRSYHGQYNNNNSTNSRGCNQMHHRDTNPNPNPSPSPSCQSGNSSGSSNCNTTLPPFRASMLVSTNDGNSDLRDPRAIAPVCYSSNVNDPDPSSLQGDEALKGKDLGSLPRRSVADERFPRRRYQELFCLQQDPRRNNINNNNNNNNNEGFVFLKRKQEAWELACALAHAYIFQVDYSSSSSRSPHQPLEPYISTTCQAHESKKEAPLLQPRGDVLDKTNLTREVVLSPSSSSASSWIRSSCMDKEHGTEKEAAFSLPRVSSREEIEEPTLVSSLLHLASRETRVEEGTCTSVSHLNENLEEMAVSLPLTCSRDLKSSLLVPSQFHPCDDKLGEEPSPTSDLLNCTSPLKNVGSKSNQVIKASKTQPRPMFLDLNIDLNSMPLSNDLNTTALDACNTIPSIHQFESTAIDLNATPVADLADECEMINGSSDECETLDQDMKVIEEVNKQEDMEEELVCIEEVVNPTQAAEWFSTHFPSPAALVS